jgi:hypothetical protein
MDEHRRPAQPRRAATAVAVGVVLLAGGLAAVLIAGRRPSPRPAASTAIGVPKRPLHATSALAPPPAPLPGWLPGHSAFTAERAVDAPLVLDTLGRSLSAIGIDDARPDAWYLGRSHGFDFFLTSSGERLCTLSFLVESGALRGRACTTRDVLARSGTAFGVTDRDHAGRDIRAYVVADGVTAVALEDATGTARRLMVRDNLALGAVPHRPAALTLSFADGHANRIPLASAGAAVAAM